MPSPPGVPITAAFLLLTLAASLDASGGRDAARVSQAAQTNATPKPKKTPTVTGLCPKRPHPTCEYGLSPPLRALS
jgi:hypothetical protein